MRYFVEVAYIGIGYSGFQTQINAKTIQGEVEKALELVYKTKFELTGSSRTDAEVNAYQNFFHLDTLMTLDLNRLYNINAVLPHDIVLKRLHPVQENAHARFDATSRTYEYVITTEKNPFQFKKAYYFPYTLSYDLLHEAAFLILNNRNFETFSKKHTQVFTFFCDIKKSEWNITDNLLTYTVEANRFLRGMVKCLVATSLKYATNRIAKSQLIDALNGTSQQHVSFDAPGYGLYLKKVSYPPHIFI